MRGLMMNRHLLITNIARHAEKIHGETEIVSIGVGMSTHRYTYGQAFSRVRRLANVLQELGAAQGDRIATLAWNDFRHFEAYYAISCFGAVCHTVNPRLFPAQIEYIINHARDRYLFIDPAFYPLIESMRGRLSSVQSVVLLTDSANMPPAVPADVYCYEELLAKASEQYIWPDLDEWSASALCYTSGTTGDPKGVLYSHRSTVLHAYAAAMPDVYGISTKDVVLPVVPMFHVNAWGLPYVAPMVGAKLVLPGASAGDPGLLKRLIAEEDITLAAGVPTVWLSVIDHLGSEQDHLNRLRMIVSGGSAVPSSLIRAFAARGVVLRQVWGMTEVSPLGTANSALVEPQRELTPEQLEQLSKQGQPIFGVDVKITDGNGRELPWDGKTSGALKVRGPWVCSQYFGSDKADAHAEEGWFETGDVAQIDPQGVVRITDRTKDLIKSGGEWISSIALEEVAMSHSAIAEAAVIAVKHPKWQERPLLVVVPRAGASVVKEELLELFRERVARWWIPDDVVIVDALPRTATGKVSKLALRERFYER